MSCYELNEQNDPGNDEVDDYEEECEEPEYVVEEFLQFENQHKQNLEEMETVKLGNPECVKEVRSAST